MRVIFFRDPPHRFSNVFVNAVRAVPDVLSSALQVLIVHKSRHAPYGGGKMWKGLKEVLKSFLDCARPDHPLFIMCGDGIRREHGKGHVTDVRVLARRMLTTQIGPIVQMRRWYTKYDAGIDLDKVWHTMLLALYVWFFAEGQDPHEIACRKSCISDDGQNYQIRLETFLTLRSSFHQRVLRSTLLCFRALWSVHKAYTENARDTRVCLEHLQLCASWQDWRDRVVIPSLHGAFFAKKVCERLGFNGSVTGAAGFTGAAQDAVADDGDEAEDAQFLRVHVRTTM